MYNSKSIQSGFALGILGGLFFTPLQAEAKKNENIADYGITVVVYPSLKVRRRLTIKVIQRQIPRLGLDSLSIIVQSKAPTGFV